MFRNQVIGNGGGGQMQLDIGIGSDRIALQLDYEHMKNKSYFAKFGHVHPLSPSGSKLF